MCNTFEPCTVVKSLRYFDGIFACSQSCVNSDETTQCLWWKNKTPGNTISKTLNSKCP